MCEAFGLLIMKWKIKKQGCSNLRNMRGLYEVTLDHEQPESTPFTFHTEENAEPVSRGCI